MLSYCFESNFFYQWEHFFNIKFNLTLTSNCIHFWQVVLKKLIKQFISLLEKVTILCLTQMNFNGNFISKLLHLFLIVIMLLAFLLQITVPILYCIIYGIKALMGHKLFHLWQNLRTLLAKFMQWTEIALDTLCIWKFHKRKGWIPIFVTTIKALVNYDQKSFIYSPSNWS